MDDMDPGGGNDPQPPSHSIIRKLTTIRPSDAYALSLSLPLRSF